MLTADMAGKALHVVEEEIYNEYLDADAERIFLDETNSIITFIPAEEPYFSVNVFDTGDEEVDGVYTVAWDYNNKRLACGNAMYVFNPDKWSEADDEEEVKKHPAVLYSPYTPPGVSGQEELPWWRRILRSIWDN